MTREEQIRLRAYYLWESAGKPQGRDLEFWHKAEAIYDHWYKPFVPYTSPPYYMGDGIVLTTSGLPQTITLPPIKVFPPPEVQLTYTEAPAWPYITNIQNITMNGPHATSWVPSDDLLH